MSYQYRNSHYKATIGSDNGLAPVRRLFVAKPLSEPMLGYCQLDPKEQTYENFNTNSYIFIHENAFENVLCEMAAILSRPQYVKTSTGGHQQARYRL